MTAMVSSIQTSPGCASASNNGAQEPAQLERCDVIEMRQELRVQGEFSWHKLSAHAYQAQLRMSMSVIFPSCLASQIAPTVKVLPPRAAQTRGLHKLSACMRCCTFA